MDLFFSVVIPAYNAEAFVEESIDSALMQKDVKFEVIIVNDGSTDKTPEIINKYSHLLKIVNQKNAGLSAARNSGVGVATGNVIAFLDSDDIWLPGKLSAQSIKLNEGYKIVYTNRTNFGQIVDLPEIQSDVVAMKEGDLWEDLLLGNMITASSSVIVKELFHKIGGFRNNLRSCEDWDLWLRCSQNNKIGYCPEPLVKYRIHSAGLSQNYKFMCEKRMQVITYALNSARGRGLPDIKKRKIIAKTWSTSAWDAASCKDIQQSLKYYFSSLRSWPLNTNVWYDIARVLAGRV